MNNSLFSSPLVSSSLVESVKEVVDSGQEVQNVNEIAMYNVIHAGMQIGKKERDKKARRRTYAKKPVSPEVLAKRAARAERAAAKQKKADDARHVKYFVNAERYDKEGLFGRKIKGKGPYKSKIIFEEKFSYSAARKGEDIGKPGKNFAKIAAKSGGGEKGKRIAGAILAKIRAKHGIHESVNFSNYMDKGVARKLAANIARDYHKSGRTSPTRKGNAYKALQRKFGFKPGIEKLKGLRRVAFRMGIGEAYAPVGTGNPTYQEQKRREEREKRLKQREKQVNELKLPPRNSGAAAAAAARRIARREEKLEKMKPGKARRDLDDRIDALAKGMQKRTPGHRLDEKFTLFKRKPMGFKKASALRAAQLGNQMATPQQGTPEQRRKYAQLTRPGRYARKSEAARRASMTGTPSTPPISPNDFEKKYME